MPTIGPLVTVGCLLLVPLLATACQAGGDDSPSPASPTGQPTPVAKPTIIATDQLIAGRATFYGSQADDGAAAMAPGDFNGDGALDVVLAAPMGDGPDDSRPNAGEAYIFLGPFAPGEERDAALGEQQLTVYGADTGDQLARAVAAGDVDGDGIDDIILGAPFGDGPDNGREDAGEVRVLLGSPTLGEGTNLIDLAVEATDIAIYGADPQDVAAFALATADVNGDGRKDVIIGALWADGPQDTRSMAGEVYAVFGSEALPVMTDLSLQEPDVTVYGAEPEDQLGEEVGAGDVNGDGIDDLILSAAFAAGPANDRRALGETYVVLGQPPAMVDISEDTPYLTVLGVDAGDQLGHSLGSGDVDGDGAADILLGAVSSDGLDNQARLAGEAALVAGGGAPGMTIDVAAGDAVTIVYAATTGDRLGRSATAGDITGDGLADLLLGAPGGDALDGSKNNAGEIWIIFGSPSLPHVLRLERQEANAVILGLDADDTLGTEVFGRPVLQVRDMNDDGLGDILVGAPRGDGPDESRTDAGEGYILFTKGGAAGG